jgi:RimJ/RimL family protein N-acetyltransferase
MEGKIIYEGKSKKGTKYTVRYPQVGDAELMLDYVNILSAERTFISFQGEQLSLASEVEYINSQLERIKNKKSVHLLVFTGRKLIGISSIDLKDRASAHEGVFGISIAREYRGQGIGKRLMELIIDEAIKNLSGLKIISLGVFANNPDAIRMYENFGFKEYGKLPKGLLYRGDYIDHIYMYKAL